jgi:hypothetical protein
MESICFWMSTTNTVKLVFNDHLWDKGKMTAQDDRPFIYDRSIDQICQF